MVTAFQIILLVIIVVSFLGVVGEKDEVLKENMLVTFLAGLVALIASVLWL